MTPELWAIAGLALVIWQSTNRIVTKLEQVRIAAQRPKTDLGFDASLEQLEMIEGRLHDLEMAYYSKASD